MPPIPAAVVPDLRSSRKLRRRYASFSETRRPSRRLFGRSFPAACAPAPPPRAPSEDELAARRSFLAKPPAPGAARRVLTVLTTSQKRASSKRTAAADRAVQTSGYEEIVEVRGETQEVREELVKSVHSDRKCVPEDERASAHSNSATSSVQSGHTLVAQPMLEVEVSEVSDEMNSNADRSLRSRRVSSSSGPNSADKETQVAADDDFVFIDDVDAASIAFNYVGDEEDEVPEAPSSVAKGIHEGRTWEAYGQQIHSLRKDLDVARSEKSSLQKAFSDQSRELNILLQSSRVRAAESNAEVEELSLQLKELRKRLNRRIRELEDENTEQATLLAEETARRRDAESKLRAELHRLSGSTACFTRSESARAVLTQRQRPLVPSHPEFRSSTYLSPISSNRPYGPDAFGRVRSAGNVHEPVRRRSSRPDMLAAQARTVPHSHRAASATSDVGSATSRTTTRRSTLMRAFVAHIHSNRYRSVRSVWFDFLGGESGQCTPEQFALAVRGLAVAANARDRDLDILRKEVCGAENSGTGVVTWAMFVRFYQRSKHDTT